MASISFGLNKTYDWSSTYWSTLTNVQNTNITTPTGADGWKVLSFITPTNTKTFSTDYTGWTASNTSGGSSSISGGVLVQTTGTGHAILTHSSFGASDNTFSLFWLSSLTTPSTSTANTTSGKSVVNFDGTRDTRMECRSDGTNIDLYIIDNAGNMAKNDTTVPISDRYQIFGYYNKDGTDKLCATINGVEVVTNAQTYAYGGIAGTVSIDCYSESASTWGDKTYRVDYFNSPTPWQIDDGILESSSSNTIFDAGLGKKWSTVTFTKTVDNSTAITVQVRCAASSAGLSSATYETIATSGDSIIAKERFIQVKVTLSDASSGRYTPVLKDLTITDELAPTTIQEHRLELGGFTLLRTKDGDISQRISSQTGEWAAPVSTSISPFEGRRCLIYNSSKNERREYIYTNGSWVADGNFTSLTASGSLSVSGTTLLKGNLTVSGTIFSNGTIDGRNIPLDGTNQDSHIAASSNVHGITGSVVGTTDSQTLTNKTITNPIISGTLLGEISTFTSVQGIHKASNGTQGVTAGPYTTISSITVKDGLVIAITGS